MRHSELETAGAETASSSREAAQVDRLQRLVCEQRRAQRLDRRVARVREVREPQRAHL